MDKSGPDGAETWNGWFGIGLPRCPPGTDPEIMQLPGFLRRNLAETPKLPEDGATRGSAARGCIIGCLAALFIWFVPIPVATIVWVFDLKGPFGDYMILALPFLLMLPIVGAIIAEQRGRRHRTNSCQR
jgi:hypothetical protein